MTPAVVIVAALIFAAFALLAAFERARRSTPRRDQHRCTWCGQPNPSTATCAHHELHCDLNPRYRAAIPPEKRALP